MAIDIDLTRYPKGPRLSAYLFAKRAKIAASAAFKRPLSSPHCGDWTPDGLISRTFKFRSGEVKVVKLHARVMVAFLKALAVDPRLEVTASADSRYSGSYRTFEQQNSLYQDYIHHVPGSHLAANPCSGYHRTGRALDLLPLPGDPNRILQEKVMGSVRVTGQRFYHGDVFGDPPHYSFAELG